MNRFKLLAMATLLAVPIMNACGEDVVPPTPTGSMAGQVSIEGQGIDGITVTLSSGATATTAGGGAYRFDDLEGGAYTITISNYPEDANFNATSATATLADDDEVVMVAFTGSWIRTSAITGTVTVENDGLNGATVKISGVSDSETRADADGRYAFSGLRAGDYTIGISGFDTDEYGFDATSKSVTVALFETATVEFDGIMLRTAGIMGQVAVAGSGIGGVMVTLDGKEHRTGTTLDDGRFSFSGLAAGDYTLSVSGYDEDEYQFVASREITLALGEPELGKLASLRYLYLANNSLTGPIPPELADLARLWTLTISYNADLSGALPDNLVSLQYLDDFHAEGTDPCAPLNSSFNAWLEALRSYRVARCDPGAAYLTQAVQSRYYPVALVEGEKALLRAFVTAANPGKATMPPVVARFYRDGREVYEVEIPATSHPIPKQVAEGILKASANAEIPGRVVRPGLELVVEVDPDGTLDDSVGVVKRIPAEGRLAIDVRKLPLFDLTLIPFLWTEDPDSSLIGTVKAMAADPQNHELLKQTADLMPVGDFEATAHAPVETDSNSGYSVLGQTHAIRATEGGTGHWMGMLPRFSDMGGVAYLGHRTSASVPRSDVIVHELGHNFSLYHAPCGRPKPNHVDRDFPDRRGRIGAWGYAVRAVRGFAKGQLVRPTVPDLMSYCGDPEWISDYHFNKAGRYRLKSEPQERRRNAAGAPARSLLLWGGVDSTATLHLEPTFVVDAPPALPEAAGDYELEGRTADGAVLFSLAFAMPRIADVGEGAGGFAYVLPIRPEWGRLASITLSGPEGDVTMDGGTDSPMAIYRDRRSGQVRAMLRGDAPRPGWARSGFDVFRSRGIPSVGTGGNNE